MVEDILDRAHSDVDMMYQVDLKKIQLEGLLEDIRHHKLSN